MPLNYLPRRFVAPWVGAGWNSGTPWGGVVLAVRFGFESWFWVGVTFWLFLVCDIGDDKATDVS